MIPTVLLLGFLSGVLARRRASVAVLAAVVLGTAWAVLIVTTVGGDFAGAFAFGAVNAAVGVLLGVVVARLATDLRTSLGRSLKSRGS